MMKKIFLGIILLLGLLIGTLIVSVSLIDYTKIYKDFAESIKVDLSGVSENGFKVEKFPVPYLIIDQIEQKGKVKVENVEIRFSWISLITFNPQITDIKIKEAKIYLAHDDVNFLSHDEFISELIAKDVLSVSATIDKLIFVESDEDIAFEIDDFNFQGGSDLTKFSGKVDLVGELSGEFIKSDDVMFKLVVKDANYLINLEENYNNNFLQKGKFAIEVSGIEQEIIQLIPDFMGFSGAVKSNEKINITSDIVPTENHINLKNIVISSESFKGSGEINLSKNINDIHEVKLSFDKMDMSSLYKGEESNRLNYTPNQRFDFSKNRANADISIKNIKLDANNSLSDVDISAKIDEGELHIHNFSANVNENGKFQLKGTITQNNFRNLFNGQIALSHRDINDLAGYLGGEKMRTDISIPFYLVSDVKMSSVGFSLQNLLIKTKDTNLSGNISTKFIGNSPRTNATIRISSFDADKGNFPVLPQIFDYAIQLFEGMREDDYLNKFTPIRKVNSISKYDLTFDRLTFGSRLYKDVNCNLEISPGAVSIEHLFIQNGDDWVDTSVNLKVLGLKPAISVTIHNGSIAADFLSASGMLELRNKILDNFDLSKIDIVMNCSIKKLYQGAFSLGRVLFQAKNNKNLLEIEKFNTDVFGGRIQSSGSILLDPYTVNFVYAMNSAQISEIAKLLPEGIIKTGGVFSATGMFSTEGDQLDKQLYNLYTMSNLVAKDITINNFSIDDFIKKIGVSNYNILNLKEDIKKSILTGKTEISDLKTSIELSKGIFKLSSMVFKTKYSAGSGFAKFNLYDFNIDNSTMFSFYLSKPRFSNNSQEKIPAKIKVTATGNLFSPKKNAESKELEELLKARNEK